MLNSAWAEKAPHRAQELVSLVKYKATGVHYPAKEAPTGAEDKSADCFNMFSTSNNQEYFSLAIYKLQQPS
ncbi:MAG: hypothetical protein A3F17_08830 [Gammaproteobacteria bacterium RIFCSPHIGHO2_12_FULL_41_15]|nr:MAG: hypothetical protein A3F17_08830 [Gammaproteobacteria bacterium RIFCSPHIGHO2_12_FULL_41_15]